MSAVGPRAPSKDRAGRVSVSLRRLFLTSLLWCIHGTPALSTASISQPLGDAHNTGRSQAQGCALGSPSHPGVPLAPCPACRLTRPVGRPSEAGMPVTRAPMCRGCVTVPGDREAVGERREKEVQVREWRTGQEPLTGGAHRSSLSALEPLLISGMSICLLSLGSPGLQRGLEGWGAWLRRWTQCGLRLRGSQLLRGGKGARSTQTTSRTRRRGLCKSAL